MSRFARVWFRRNNHKWTDVMDDICKSYNSTYHSSIHNIPKDINDSNAADVFYHLYKSIIGKTPEKPKYAVGDKVHVRGFRTVFGKRYLQQYSPDIYLIKEVIKTIPITYKLVDDEGGKVVSTYYEAELIPASISD